MWEKEGRDDGVTERRESVEGKSGAVELLCVALREEREAKGVSAAKGREGREGRGERGPKAYETVETFYRSTFDCFFCVVDHLHFP